MKKLIAKIKNTKDYENLKEILGEELGTLIYQLVDEADEADDGSSAYYVLGVLRACEFLTKKFDEPTMAANIIRDELVVSGFCSLKYAKQLAKSEDVNLTKVWKESCLRGLL